MQRAVNMTYIEEAHTFKWGSCRGKVLVAHQLKSNTSLYNVYPMCINITAVPTTCQRTDTPAPDFKEKIFFFWDVKYGEQVWSWQLEYKNTKNQQCELWIKTNMKADAILTV